MATRTRKDVTEKRIVEEPTDAAGEDAGVAPADVPQGVVESAPKGGHLTEAEWFASQEPADPVPNVQSEAQHASQAPEDVRDGAVAEPNT